MSNTRRDFLKKSVIGATGIGIAGMTGSSVAKAGILGSNNKIVFAVVGLNGRGNAHVNAIAACENVEIGFVCDVDSRVLERSVEMVKKLTGKKPKAVKDFRELIKEKDLDVVTIATPEHWHAPMAIMAMNAGKHVYVEKPCSFNPEEGELLVETANKTGLLCQMGNQQRSAPTSKQAMIDISQGIIGEVYYGKAWYSNRRGSIGYGKVTTPPDWLDWELWQGPAPRRAFKDNWVHYNWHWIRDYGTGEINNNATHEIDICRWALGVEVPVKVSSSGGRFHFQDDWEYFDTQNVSYEYAEGKMITWEGRSCNSFNHYNRGRGVTLHGTEGTILLDRNNYIVWDRENKEVQKITEEEVSATTNVVGIGALDVYHMRNLVNAIRNGESLNSPIQDARLSTLHCHLGNISQDVGRTLYMDTAKAKIIGDGQALQYWSREYEPGWEPRNWK